MYKHLTLALALGQAAQLTRPYNAVELAQVKFEVNPQDDWDVIGDNTCADIESVLEILGASGHSSWTHQSDESTKNVWTYMDKIYKRVDAVQNAIGTSI